MAPTDTSSKMSHRAKALARLADPSLPRKVHRDGNAVTDAFLHSKRDKQLIRKSVFRARLSERRTKLLESRVAGEKLGRAMTAKRRRPSKKLVATLQSLIDALPDIERTPTDEQTKKADSRKNTKTSLQSRPGALKRKENLVRSEIARFDSNLAHLMTTSAVNEPESTDSLSILGKGDANVQAVSIQEESTTPSTSSSRWEILRGFITATMDKSSLFSEKQQ